MRSIRPQKAGFDMGLPKGLVIRATQFGTQATLYETNIVTINHEKKCIILRNGGWVTNHTKKCINLVLKDFGLEVRQVKGNWYVIQFDTHLLPEKVVLKDSVPFRDGMSISI